jgi:hypothetical protein
LDGFKTRDSAFESNPIDRYFRRRYHPGNSPARHAGRAADHLTFEGQLMDAVETPKPLRLAGAKQGTF